MFRPRRISWIIVPVVIVALAAAAFFGLAPNLVAWYLLPTQAPASVSAQAQALHSKLVIVDLHADSLLWSRNLLRRGNWGHVDLPRLIDGNVALQVFTVLTQYRQDDGKHPASGTRSPAKRTDLITPLAIAQLWPPAAWTSPFERALHQADKLAGFVRRSSSGLAAIRSAPDIDQLLVARLQAEGLGLAPPVGTMLALQGLEALTANPKALDRLFDAGFRVVGIATPGVEPDSPVEGTPAERRPADGVTAEAAPKRLSDASRALIWRIEAQRMVIDVAELTDSEVLDVLATATRPVIVSYSGVRATCDRPGNLSDQTLSAIAAKGGLIGIGFSPAAVCEKSVEAIVAAIRHAVTVAGIDHVGFGSNFDGSVDAPIDAAGMVLLTQALTAGGFSDGEIAKLSGGNALRLLRSLLPG